MTFSVELLLVAALAGYLVGSISFARIVARFVAPGADLARTSFRFTPESQEVEMGGVGAGTLALQAGPRWGLLAAGLDIAKAALVTLAFRLVAPDEPAYLAAAAFAVIGHTWPVYYRFQGGFGMSPLLGGLIVIDPLAPVVTIPIGLVVSRIIHDRVFAYDGWTLLLVPWFLVVRADPAEALYAVIVVAVLWSRFRRLRRDISSSMRAPRTSPPPA